MLEIFKRTPVYCQKCGTELTHLSGQIIDDGKLVCYFGGKRDSYHRTARQIQRDIKTGAIIYFGKLEKYSIED